MNERGPGTLNPYARPDEYRRLHAGLSDYCEDFFPAIGTRRLQELAANAMSADDNEVLAPWYADVLEAHAKLVERCPGITKRHRIRQELAEYIGRAALSPACPKDQRGYYLSLGDRLKQSRQWAIWGIDAAGELLLSWDGAAGLVKLCPDDAREEGQRVVEQYGDLLELAAAQGAELRYAVYTLPNVPLGEFANARDELFLRYHDQILYAKKGGGTVRKLDDDRRRFPNLVGAIASMEQPLAADRENWNPHINVLEVHARRPSCKEQRAAWGFNMRIQKLGGGRGWRPGEQSIREAIAELVKYAVKHTSEKADDKAGSVAPGICQWPYAAFFEWYEGQRGRRRTRSWGTLYGAPRPEPVEKELTTWAGRLRFIDGEASAGAPILHHPAGAAGLNLIQRNKSAGIAPDFAGGAVDNSGRSSSDPPDCPAWML